MSIEVDPEDMEAAIKGVIKIADNYGNCIDVLATEVYDKADPAFETGDNSPKGAWQDCLDMLWGVLADSQDEVNTVVDKLIDYSKEISDIDDGTAKDLQKQADALDKATHPKEG